MSKKDKENKKDEDNVLNIQYNIENSKNINIFGKPFVKNNKNKCSIITDNKEIDLCSNLNIEAYESKKNILLIQLKGIKNINNFGHMFENCSNLIYFSNFNTNNFTHLNHFFKNCSSLKSLPDISYYKTSNVINMRSMFEGCTSLISLPDISKWDISNVTHINNIFSGCHSLLYLPDNI